jgi:proteasome lid subunit RPN8/RPN11
MVFSGSSDKVKTVSEREYVRKVKTNRVLVKPEVIAEFFVLSAFNPKREIAALLGGRVVGGYVEVHCLRHIRSNSTMTSVSPSPSEFRRVHDELLKEKLYIVGWAHSHPGHGVFMSSTDINTQKDYQASLPDSIALVLDPFGYGRISFKFFRVGNGRPREIPYDWLIR